METSMFNEQDDDNVYITEDDDDMFFVELSRCIHENREQNEFDDNEDYDIQ
ncbi:10342_t:CDS:1, partial [Racocetra fulgida]